MRMPALLMLLAAFGAGACATKSAPSSPSTSTAERSGASGGTSSSSGNGASAAGGAAAAGGSSAAGAAGAAGTSGTAAGGTTAGGASGAGGSALPPVAQTADERRAQIERSLDESVGTFDANLKSEQARIAQERDARGVAGVTATAGSATPEGPGRKRHRGDDHDHDGTRQGDLKSVGTDTGTNAGGTSGNGASAREVPDGSDDDIVARRLRKAWEQETDPELKDKLWKEYLEYKKNGQTK